jgi:tRNA (adenine22-N1)-methyltransferase
MNLSKRLQTIYDMVPVSIVADIGADHGKLIISLVENNIAVYGYAVENKKGPFDRLCEAINESKAKDKIKPIFSDGIRDLPMEVSTVVIAGMGGSTVVNILKAHVENLINVKTIIVDAHTSIPLIREEISKLGFAIADEKIIEEDGIYYEIIKFVKSGIAFYSDMDIEFGPVLRTSKSQTFKEKYQMRLREIDELIKTKELPENRIIKLNDEKIRIRNIL